MYGTLGLLQFHAAAMRMAASSWVHNNSAASFVKSFLSLQRSRRLVTSAARQTLHSTAMDASEEDLTTLCSQGRLREALETLHLMDSQRISLDSSAYESLLQACVDYRALPEAKLVHAHIILTGYKSRGVFLHNRLVNMYAKCGSLVNAHTALDQISEPNAVSFSVMIAAYAREGHGEKAWTLFYQMKRKGIQPDEFTVPSVLRACGLMAELECGRQVHGQIIKSNAFQVNIFIGSALVDMYVKCRSLEDARNIFDKMPERNVVSWNAMIAGYAENGWLDKALDLFENMPKRDVVSWNLMISGYAGNGRSKEALELFYHMQEKGIRQNRFTFTSVLPACADLGELKYGKDIHGEVNKSRLQSDVFVGSALVDMYVKCGSIKDAHNVFDEMSERNVVTWNSIIAGYAQSGQAEEALALFCEMRKAGICLNEFTYGSVLPACAWPVRAFGILGSSHVSRTFLGSLKLLVTDPVPCENSRPGTDFKAYEPQSVWGSGGKNSKFAHKNPDQDRTQIFIRLLSGKTISKKIWTGTLIKNVKEEIQVDTGIPTNLLNLVYAGRILQEIFTLQHYGIGRDTTIILSSRLRGGSSGAGPKGFQGSTSKPTGSYRDAAKGKAPSKGKEPADFITPLGQYIVDQTPELPSISLDLPEVKCIFSDLENKAVICRFNGFWPKTEALYQWIHTVWTKDCQIHLCSKGFFIVTFLEIEERDNILNEGPWFWGSAGLFVTPWFPEFDANTMVVSRMPVWVRLHNLPLHFWHFKSLTTIGNSLGRMLKIDTDRHLKGIFTFARICVEVDLSKGLPESILLTFNNIQWKQPLDYENTAFRCRGCQQTGHLLKACPSKSKPQQRKSRGWQNLNEVLARRTAQKTAPSEAEEVETEAEEDDTTIEEVEIENQKEDTAVNKDSLPHTSQVETQQDKAETIIVDQITGGNKRHH